VVVRLPALGDVHEEGGDGIAVPVKAVDVAHIGLDQLGDRLDVVEVQPDGAGTDREVEVVREIEPLPVGADPEAVVRVNAAPVRIAGRSQPAGQRQRRPAQIRAGVHELALRPAALAARPVEQRPLFVRQHGRHLEDTGGQARLLTPDALCELARPHAGSLELNA
jgi:hypothetical protein